MTVLIVSYEISGATNFQADRLRAGFHSLSVQKPTCFMPAFAEMISTFTVMFRVLEHPGCSSTTLWTPCTLSGPLTRLPKFSVVVVIVRQAGQMRSTPAGQACG